MQPWRARDSGAAITLQSWDRARSQPGSRAARQPARVRQAGGGAVEQWGFSQALTVSFSNSDRPYQQQGLTIVLFESLVQPLFKLVDQLLKVDARHVRQPDQLLPAGGGTGRGAQSGDRTGQGAQSEGRPGAGCTE